MSSVKENLIHIKNTLPSHVTLIAVSKTKPIELLQEAYDAGQRYFGENYVQELVDKHEQLPKDIHWHFIGHLQSNKVKYIAPFVYLIHGVDSFKLLKEMGELSLRLYFSLTFFPPPAAAALAVAEDEGSLVLELLCGLI